jgi:RNA polymerase sigma-70 factor (ECF subfamily)
MAARAQISRKDSDDQVLLKAVLSAPKGRRRDAAWTRLVSRFDALVRSSVRKVLRRYGALHNQDDLEDLVGEAWLQLLAGDLRKLRQYDPSRGYRVASFVALVAINSTIDQLRARQQQTESLDELDEGGWLSDPAPRPDELAQRAELVARTRCILERLDPEEREFARRVFLDEEATEDVARDEGVAINTVYTRKFRLRAKLAEKLEEVAA